VAVLAVIGLGVSVYLTAAHYQQFPLACSTTGVIDCGSVTHSSYSVVFGVPVSVLGLGWFVLMGCCAVVTVPTSANGSWLAAQLVLATCGLAFVLYLMYAELVQLHRICEWCTLVHLLTIGIVLLTVSRLQSEPGG
jgi:uncharacterized membrane protein